MGAETRLLAAPGGPEQLMAVGMRRLRWCWRSLPRCSCCLSFQVRPTAQGAEGELVEWLSAYPHAGARVRGVFEWKFGKKSAKANAALTGLGTTRRVIISDTLLNAASSEQIEAVFAHELGHRRIWSGPASRRR